MMEDSNGSVSAGRGVRLPEITAGGGGGGAAGGGGGWGGGGGGGPGG